MALTDDYTLYRQHDELVRGVWEKIERCEQALRHVKATLEDPSVDAEGGDGDVVLSVNFKGQLTALSLAEGCTKRHSNLSLEELLNTTLHAAVKAAAAEFSAAVDSAADTTLA